MNRKDRLVWLLVFGTAVIATLIVYAPMLAGRIPFPADMVLGFPPYARVSPEHARPLHGNIGDLVMSFYPYRTLLARAAREGTLPFWNPYMMSGSPFVASAQSAVFYPPNFLYYVLPVPLAWSIGFVIRRVLAMVFTFLFARRIGCSTAAALSAGLLFSFCGFMTGWQGQAMSDAAIWLPLICYSVVRLRSDLTLRSVAITAVAFTMPVLAGHPETAAHLTLTGVAFALALLPGPRAISFIKCFAAAGLLSLGLAAVQVLPTMEWLSHIYHGFDSWPTLKPWTIVALVSRDIIRSISSIGLRIPEEAAYLGMICLVAAPLAVKHPARRIVAFWIVWTSLMISIVYGVGPGAWLAEHSPGIKALKNMRLILVYSFGLCTLAGLGLSWLEDAAERASTSERQRAAAIAAIGFSVSCALLYVCRSFVTETIEYTRLPKFSFLLLLASTAIIASRLFRLLGRRPFQILVVGVTAFDVLSVSYAAIPHAKPSDIFPRVDVFERLPHDERNPSRIAGLNYAYGTNFEMPYGLQAVGGYEIGLKRIKHFLEDVTRVEMDSVSLSTDGVLDTSDRRIDMLNVKYVIIAEWDPRYMDFRKQPERFRLIYAMDDTDVYENLRAMPGAFLVPTFGVEVIPDEAAQLQRLKDPSFDPLKSVVLQQKPPETGTRPSIHSNVEWVRRRTNDFELKVATDQPSMLVISQSYYPGWQAYIDGRQVPITIANYLLPAIFVSPGPHDVRFTFVSLPIRVGLILSLASAGLLIWFAFGARTKHVSLRGRQHR